MIAAERISFLRRLFRRVPALPLPAWVGPYLSAVAFLSCITRGVDYIRPPHTPFRTEAGRDTFVRLQDVGLGVYGWAFLVSGALILIGMCVRAVTSRPAVLFMAHTAALFVFGASAVSIFAGTIPHPAGAWSSIAEVSIGTSAAFVRARLLGIEIFKK